MKTYEIKFRYGLKTCLAWVREETALMAEMTVWHQFQGAEILETKEMKGGRR